MADIPLSTTFLEVEVLEPPHVIAPVQRTERRINVDELGDLRHQSSHDRKYRRPRGLQRLVFWSLDVRCDPERMVRVLAGVKLLAPVPAHNPVAGPLRLRRFAA